MGILCKWLSLSRFCLTLTVHFRFGDCDSPLVTKVRSRAGSSGVSTPAVGALKSLSERDLQKANAALNEVTATEETA
jgi:hypothetical protein